MIKIITILFMALLQTSTAEAQDLHPHLHGSSYVTQTVQCGDASLVWTLSLRDGTLVTHDVKLHVNEAVLSPKIRNVSLMRSLSDEIVRADFVIWKEGQCSTLIPSTERQILTATARVYWADGLSEITANERQAKLMWWGDLELSVWYDIADIEKNGAGLEVKNTPDYFKVLDSLHSHD